MHLLVLEGIQIYIKIRANMLLHVSVYDHHQELLDDLKDRRGYCHLKDEALDRTVWRNRFGKGMDLSSDRILNE